MTRQLNIEKQKLDAARAIQATLDSEDCINIESISIEDLRMIERSQLDNLSLEKLHNILGRLTPDSS